uniref:Uncharacterized protein n=1 Tax=Anguilla anguilla TaxID=7936 RepID=A0A0E9S1A3_ANGAN
MRTGSKKLSISLEVTRSPCERKQQISFC